jgi:hypothetical protein
MVWCQLIRLEACTIGSVARVPFPQLCLKGGTPTGSGRGFDPPRLADRRSEPGDASVTTMSTERIEVQRQIAAPPGKVFALLCDPIGHVTIDSSGMLQSAEGEPVRHAGDTFVVHMDREVMNAPPPTRYDMVVTITEFEQDRYIEWAPSRPGNPSAGHRYGYRLEPSESGTLVTSYYDWSQISDEFRKMGIFPVIPESGLRATLGILARNLE